MAFEPSRSTLKNLLVFWKETIGFIQTMLRMRKEI